MSRALRSQNSTIAWGGQATPATPLTLASLVSAAAAVNAWKQIEEATEIKPSGQKVDEIDVTHLQSIAKEFTLGLEDSGSIDITANFFGGKYQQQLLTEKASKTLSLYQYTIGAELAIPITYSFYAYVVKAELPDAKVNGKLELSATLRISGPVAVNFGSEIGETY